jgi:hypothetical protein
MEVQNPQLQRNFPIIEKCVELKTINMRQMDFGTGGWPPISTWIIFILILYSKEHSRGIYFQKRKLLLGLLTLTCSYLLNKPY